MLRRSRFLSLLSLLISWKHVVAFQSTNSFRYSDALPDRMAFPPTADPKKRLIWRYLKECHGKMNDVIIPEIFHPDAVLNNPNGAEVNSYDISRVCKEEFWPLIKPGTIRVEVDFLTHEWSAVPPSAKLYPAEELQRFKATIAGERHVPDDNGDGEVTFILDNIWRVVDDKCIESWPAAKELQSPYTQPRKALKKEIFQTRENRISKGQWNPSEETPGSDDFSRPMSQQSKKKDWVPSEGELLKSYNDIIANVVTPGAVVEPNRKSNTGVSRGSTIDVSGKDASASLSRPAVGHANGTGSTTGSFQRDKQREEVSSDQFLESSIHGLKEEEANKGVTKKTTSDLPQDLIQDHDKTPKEFKGEESIDYDNFNRNEISISEQYMTAESADEDVGSNVVAGNEHDKRRASKSISKRITADADIRPKDVFYANRVTKTPSGEVPDPKHVPTNGGTSTDATSSEANSTGKLEDLSLEELLVTLETSHPSSQASGSKSKQLIPELLNQISSNEAIDALDALKQLAGDVIVGDTDGSVRIAIFLACGQLRIVTAMQQHDLYDIQYWGCVALGRLAFAQNGWTLDVIGGHDGLRMGLASVGALESILEAMANFPTDTMLNQEAIKALLNIMYCQRNLSLSSDKGVIDVVVQSMKMLPDDKIVQSLACRLLWHVCLDHPEGKIALTRAQALSSLSAVLENESLDESTEAHDLATQAIKAFLTCDVRHDNL